jgi:tetratricopeptide (TPR) repeat protein
VIEILLQAERTLATGRLDEAERLYRQAADADPRNSIAVVGLARIALERGDEPEAYRQGRRALEIDPENVAAQRLTQRLQEVYAYRGESIEALAGVVAPVAGTANVMAPEAGSPSSAQASPAPSSSSTPAVAPPQPRGIVDRLFRRSRS